MCITIRSAQHRDSTANLQMTCEQKLPFAALFLTITTELTVSIVSHTVLLSTTTFYLSVPVKHMQCLTLVFGTPTLSGGLFLY